MAGNGNGYVYASDLVDLSGPQKPTESDQSLYVAEMVMREVVVIGEGGGGWGERGGYRRAGVRFLCVGVGGEVVWVFSGTFAGKDAVAGTYDWIRRSFQARRVGAVVHLRQRWKARWRDPRLALRFGWHYFSSVLRREVCTW